MSEWSSCYGPLLGRIFIGGYFVWSGVIKTLGFVSVVDTIATAGLPYPVLGAILAIVIEVGLGLAIVLGYHVRMAGLLLALWTILVSFLFHTNLSDQVQATMLLKNIAIAGGLLYLSSFGPGAFHLKSKNTRR